MKIGKFRIGMSPSGCKSFCGRLFVIRNAEGCYVDPFYTRKALAKYKKKASGPPTLLFTTYWIWKFYLSIHTPNFLKDQVRLNSVFGIDTTQSSMIKFNA